MLLNTNFQQKPKGISLNKNAVNILNHQQQQQLPQQQQQQPLALVKQPLILPTKQAQQQQQVVQKSSLLLQLQTTDENYVPHQSPNEPLPPKLRFFGRESPNRQRESLVSRIPRLLSTKLEANNSQKDAAIVIKPFRDTIKEEDEQVDNNSAARQKATVPAVEEALVEEVEEEPVEDIDKSTTNRDAIYLVCEIAEDIYDYLRELELAQSIKRDYLRDQKILTPKVRGRLINWCIAIHQQLKLLPETLYQAVAVIDRYFEQVTVKKQREVQIAGVVGILIASKYEEIYPPDVGDLLHLTRNEYTRDEIFRQEINMLTQLEHNLGRPIPLSFLRRFSRAAHCDLKMHSIAKFLMELSLSEYECSHWRPSMLAAASLYATMHLVDNDRHHQHTSSSGFNFLKSSSTTTLSAKSPKTRWNKTLVHYSHYTGDELKEPASILCKILKRAMDSPQSYEAVKKNSPNMDRWPELKSPRVDKLIKLGQF